MRISCNWLRTYVDLPDDLPGLADMLTNSGLEVEEIIDTAPKFTNVVVGEVLERSAHPNADKLSLCTVTDGTDTFQVVCGAPNVAAGQKIAFARPGARLDIPGITIEPRKLRGIESFGMICSESELGVSEDHGGIMVLDPDAALGQPMGEYLELGDVIFGIGITPNRGDALSHIGVARDVSALTGNPARIPDVPPVPTSPSSKKIVIQDGDLCPRYSGAIIRNIRVVDSPKWMKRALEAAGLRPINAIVDVTNYVMMEIGQPMHAFDLETLEGDSIIVRAGTAGEKFRTLDGKEHELPERALLICDSIKPVALAGVMGGENSDIRPETTSIFLESAYFNPSSVRRTAKRLGISTESSYRFERGGDPEITIWALQRAIGLILEIAGGEVEGLSDAYPAPIPARKVTLRPPRVKDILGVDIPQTQMVDILTRLGFSVEEKGSVLECVSPSFRTEMDREIDLIEEIVRIYGCDRIPTPVRIPVDMSEYHDDEAFADSLRNICLSFGLDEILSTSLVPSDLADMFNPGKRIDVLNPVNAERPSLRTSIAISLLEAVSLNLRNGTRSLSVFEMGTVFARPDEGEKTLVPGSRETMTLGLAMTGLRQEREWHSPARNADFFDLKGIIETLFEKLGVASFAFAQDELKNDVNRNGVSIIIDGRKAGYIGEVSSIVGKKFDIDQHVFISELSIESLRTAIRIPAKFVSFSRFPAVKRDLAFVMPNRVYSQEVLDAVRSANAAHLIDVRVVDVFEGKGIEEGKKSVAITLTFQSSERTLTDEEINASVTAIQQTVNTTCGGVLRS